MTRIDKPGGTSPGPRTERGEALPTTDADVATLDEVSSEGATHGVAGELATDATIGGGAVAEVTQRAQRLLFSKEYLQGSVPVSEAKAATMRRTTALGGKVSTGLNAVGAVATAADKLESSTAQTTLGKTADALASGGLSYALGSNPVTGTFLAVDAAVEKGLDGAAKELTGNDDVHFKVGVGTHLSSSVTAVVTLVEGVATGDSTGMREFMEQAKRGERGVLMQGYIQLGEVLDFSEGLVVAKEGIDSLWSAIADD